MNIASKTANDHLYTIEKENNRNPDVDKSFLLEEIKYREEEIERLIKYLNKHIVNVPEWVEEIADEYGIELE